MGDMGLKVGDYVRVVRIPSHIDAPDYPNGDTNGAFAATLNNIYQVEDVDWGGWGWLHVNYHEGIGIQPDCVELVQPARGNPK